MHSDSPSIAEKVAEAARQLGRGDLAALGHLYDVAAPRLVRYAQTLARNREDAEDALQASLARVAENPNQLAVARYPWAYFLRIVRNEALKIIGRRKPLESLSSDVQACTWDENTAEREEFRKRIQVALRQLPPEQAEVVVLKIWEGMTFLEIALILGESANTAASRYRYALAKMSRSLQPLADEVCHD